MNLSGASFGQYNPYNNPVGLYQLGYGGGSNLGGRTQYNAFDYRNNPFDIGINQTFVRDNFYNHPTLNVPVNKNFIDNNYHSFPLNYDIQPRFFENNFFSQPVTFSMNQPQYFQRNFNLGSYFAGAFPAQQQGFGGGGGLLELLKNLKF